MILKMKQKLEVCGLSSESFLAIWPSQYKFLTNEFLMKKSVYLNQYLSHFSNGTCNEELYQVLLIAVTVVLQLWVGNEALMRH